MLQMELSIFKQLYGHFCLHLKSLRRRPSVSENAAYESTWFEFALTLPLHAEHQEHDRSHIYTHVHEHSCFDSNTQTVIRQFLIFIPIRLLKSSNHKNIIR